MFRCEWYSSLWQFANAPRASNSTSSESATIEITVSPAQKRTPAKKTAPAQTTRKTVRRKPYGEKQIIGFLFGICLLLTVFLGGVLSLMVALKIPDIRTVAHYRPVQTTYIYDRHGQVVEKIFKENRTVVPLTKMPPLLPKAFVAAEDGRFFEHPGLDFFSVLRAALINVKRGERAQGGSTITQQVARSLLLTREKTYLRKFKEAILAWRIDSLLSKEEILYIYLNQIYLGAGAHGVEAAAQAYFDKHAGQLSLGEVALLAGLPQAPSRYSPLQNPKRAVQRQRYVLNRMVEDGLIDRRSAKKAFEEKLRLRQKKERRVLDGGYYTEVVKRRTAQWVNNSQLKMGLRIHTYLDARMQKEAVTAVRDGVQASFGRQVRRGKASGVAPQGAMVGLDSCSGEVRALVGGVNWGKSQYNRASMARRQPGSAFKPIVFSAALEKGWGSNSSVLDAPLAITGAGNTTWRPKNYSGQYHGQVSLTEALVYSYNTAAVRLLNNVGLSPVHQLSSDLGISSEMPGDLSLALGSVEVSLLELSSAYSVFSCDGIYTAPRFIHRIEKMDGSILVHNIPEKRRVLSINTAKEMRGMLEKAIVFGTGKRAKGLRGKSGGKTGTSDESRDAWFIGYNRNHIAGVWIGYDRNEALGKGENGGRTAAPVWLDYMQQTSAYR